MRRPLARHTHTYLHTYTIHTHTPISARSETRLCVESLRARILRAPCKVRRRHPPRGLTRSSINSLALATTVAALLEVAARAAPAFKYVQPCSVAAPDAHPV